MEVDILQSKEEETTITTTASNSANNDADFMDIICSSQNSAVNLVEESGIISTNVHMDELQSSSEKDLHVSTTQRPDFPEVIALVKNTDDFFQQLVVDMVCITPRPLSVANNTAVAEDAGRNSTKRPPEHQEGNNT
jgi:hypothetical protein